MRCRKGNVAPKRQEPAVPHEGAKAKREITPEEWPKIKDILATALECAASERAQYLDRVCGEDTALRSYLAELIAAYEQTGAQRLDTPAFSIPSSSAPPRSVIGRRTGAYRIE